MIRTAADLPKLSRRGVLAAMAGNTLLGAEPIIDIHQHTHYRGRSDEALVIHQRKMGVTKTILQPAGSKYGLDVDAHGNDSVVALARRYPNEFSFFANELPDIPETRPVLEKYLKAGAIGIGEQKFPVDCDSKPIHLIAEIAREFGVPVLMHFQHDAFNTNFERFYKVLEKFPKVNFICHAQTFWGYIDLHHNPLVLYPKTKVTPGGLADRWLSGYPNLYGDLADGSGLNALSRDEDHARGFLARHQDKLMWGSDCDDEDVTSPRCLGSRCMEAIRRLAANPGITRKILYHNASRLIKIPGIVG